jgi:PAS domain S-box-containing protein
MNVPADREERSGRVKNKCEKKRLRRGGIKQLEQTLRSALEFRDRYLEASSNAIGALDSEGKFVLANRRLAEITGYSVEALLGRSFQTLAAPEEFARIDELFMAALKHGLTASQVEAVVMRQDGATRRINFSLHPLLLEDGEPGLLMAAEDITEQKQAEAALGESETRLRMLGDNLPSGAIYQLVREPDGTIYFPYMSAGIERLTGLTAEEVMKDHRALYDLVLEEDQLRGRAASDESVRSLSIFDVEVRLRTKDGQVKWFRSRATPRRLPHGGTLWDGIMIDVTDTRRDIEALLQTVGAIIWQGEADTIANTFRFDFVSRQAERLLGYPVKAWLEDPARWIEHMHSKDRRRVLSSRSQALAARRDYEIEYRMIAQDGRTVWLREIVKVEPAHDHHIKLRGITIDVTERKQADALLHETVARNKAILKALPDLMFLTSKDGVFLDFHAKEWGVLFVPPEQFIGKNIREVFPEDLAEALVGCFEQAAKSVDPVIHEYSLPLDETKGYYEARVVSCDRGRVLSIVRDITERKRAEEALHESQERLAMATAAGGVGIWDYDLETGEIYIDPALKNILGFEDHEIRNHFDDWMQHLHPADREHVRARLEIHFSSEALACEFEHRLHHKDGSIRWFLTRGTVIKHPDGTPYRLVGTQTDITDRKRAEEALRNIAEGVSAVTGESFLRSLVQHLVKILGVNYAIVGELVEPEREMIKAIVCADGQILEPFEYSLTDTPCENVIKQQLCCYPEGVQRQFPKDKMLVEMDVESYLGAPLRDSFGRTVGLLIVMSRKPLDERKLATSMLQIFAARASAEIERKRGEAALLASQESLRRSHARVQDLAGKLITAQEEERKHLSRELHDDLNQKLASLAITIGYLKRHLPEPADFINHQLTDLEDRIFSLSNDIRQLSHELHPAVLEHIGLQMALESYCVEFSGREGIPVALDIEEGIADIQPRTALCLYRIAQEALRNVAKHSGAASANVTLSTASGGIRLVISDQGVGYDYSQARAKGGLGLISMEERVRLLGGSFQVTTQPQKGTEVRVSIPNQ